jgi:hypothetical protein
LFHFEKAIGAVDCPEEYKGFLKTGVSNFKELLERTELAEKQLEGFQMIRHRGCDE